MSSSFSLSAKTARNFLAVSLSSSWLLSLLSIMLYSDRPLSSSESEPYRCDIVPSRRSSSSVASESESTTTGSTISDTLSRFRCPVRVVTGERVEAESFADDLTTKPGVLEGDLVGRVVCDCEGDEDPKILDGFFIQRFQPLLCSSCPCGAAPLCFGGYPSKSSPS